MPYKQYGKCEENENYQQRKKNERNTIRKIIGSPQSTNP